MPTLTRHHNGKLQGFRDLTKFFANNMVLGGNCHCCQCEAEYLIESTLDWTGDPLDLYHGGFSAGCIPPHPLLVGHPENWPPGSGVVYRGLSCDMGTWNEAAPVTSPQTIVSGPFLVGGMGVARWWSWFRQASFDPYTIVTAETVITNTSVGTNIRVNGTVVAPGDDITLAIGYTGSNAGGYGVHDGVFDALYAPHLWTCPECPTIIEIRCGGTA